VAKPPTLDVKSTTKSDISLIIRQHHCKQHGGDTGYVHGYAVYYYPAGNPGKGSLFTYGFLLLKNNAVIRVSLLLAVSILCWLCSSAVLTGLECL